MKRVFSSNSQCAHVWAQQTQESGKANNVFFERSVIFSYGYHYKAAQIHTRKGKRFALVNADTYSSSTNKHLIEVRHALRGLMPYFSAPDVTDPRTAVEYADQAVKNVIAYQMKRVKIQDTDSIRYALQMITEAYQSADAIRAILDRVPLKRDIAAIAGVSKHLHKRLARYNELNPPHVVAERERQKKLEEQRIRDERRAEDAEEVAKFRAGLVNAIHTWTLDFDLLRVDADREVVQTSRGACAPLSESLKLFRALKSGADVPEGTRVGDFSFTCIDRSETDPVISIGCHRILMSEAQAVLGKYSLTVLQGGVA